MAAAAVDDRWTVPEITLRLASAMNDIFGRSLLGLYEEGCWIGRFFRQLSTRHGAFHRRGARGRSIQIRGRGRASRMDTLNWDTYRNYAKPPLAGSWNQTHANALFKGAQWTANALFLWLNGMHSSACKCILMVVSTEIKRFKLLSRAWNIILKR